MKLLVGLGNPGEKYALTRHNIGFMVLNAWVEIQEGTFSLEKKFQAEMARVDDILALKPMTMMNNSGLAVAKAAKFHKIAPEDILVIYDDKDMLFPKLRYRSDGTSGGHRGMQSVIDHLGTDAIPRLKIGVDNPLREQHQLDTADFVLKPFAKSELAQLNELILEAIKRVDKVLISD